MPGKKKEQEEVEDKKLEEQEGQEQEETFEPRHQTPAQQREAMIDQIVANNDREPEEPEEELEEGEKEPEEPEEEIEEGEVKEPEEPEEELEEGEKEPELEKRKIIVDGQEQEVLLSEIVDAGIATLQKQAAADSRLEEAARLLREAQEVAQPPDTEEGVDTKEPQKDAKLDSAKIRELTEAIQYGDEEEAGKALEEIISMRGREPETTIPPVGDIVTRVRDELRMERIMDQLHAPPEQGGFGDLAKDPKLIAIANWGINKAIQAGAPYTWETCRKACQDTRDWINSFKPEKPSAKNELQAKRERKKASIDEAKSAAVRDTKTTKEPKPQTTSEVIAEMRKARGQV